MSTLTHATRQSRVTLDVYSHRRAVEPADVEERNGSGTSTHLPALQAPPPAYSLLKGVSKKIIPGSSHTRISKRPSSCT